MFSALLIGLAMNVAQWPEAPDWAPRLMTQEEAAEGFYPLFDGNDLEGWRVRGAVKDAFQAKDGVLAVTGKGGGWLFTDREYENFVLRLEYRVTSDKGNSGVAIRTTTPASAPTALGNPAFTGMEVQVLEPQATPSTGSAGALYGSIAPALKADKPIGEWNALEILCDGPRVRTTMNGQLLYDIKTTDETKRDDDFPPLARRAKCGFIALQDHGDYVEYRTIRIKPLPGGEGWLPLFNGKDLTGWNVIGKAQWQVLQDGILRTTGASGIGRSELRTTSGFDDFALRLSIRPHKIEGDGGAKSAVFFRGVGDAPWPRTYEVVVDNHDPLEFTGTIRGQAPARELRAMDDCWFHMDIVAKGPSIQVAVNGKVVVDYMSDKHPKCPKGWISLQSHDPNSPLDFKDIEVKQLE